MSKLKSWYVSGKSQSMSFILLLPLWSHTIRDGLASDDSGHVGRFISHVLSWTFTALDTLDIPTGGS